MWLDVEISHVEKPLKFKTRKEQTMNYTMHKAEFFISDWAVLQNLVHFLYLVSNTASVCVLKWKVGCSYSIRNYSITPLETANLKQCATRVNQLKLQKPLVCRREILKFTTKTVKWTSHIAYRCHLLRSIFLPKDEDIIVETSCCVLFGMYNVQKHTYANIRLSELLAFTYLVLNKSYHLTTAR